MKKIKVLIIDDSALMRKLLSDLLSSDPRIEVVGTAMDPYVAREKIKTLKPDVLTLDVEMPRMDGLQFLRNLMRLHPLPVVMVSSLTQNNAEVTMRALALGAVDFVSKPKIDLEHSLADCAEELTAKIVAASKATVEGMSGDDALAARYKAGAAGVGSAMSGQHYETTDQVIAIGASTGGTEAIKEVLIRMRPDSPGIVVTQHIPPVFSTSFAKRMNDITPLVCCEAEDGQQILSGHAYIARGDRHLEVVKDGARYRCRVTDGPEVNRHKPAVDVLFDSVAKSVGRNAIGVILTGMGRDGALGMKRLHEAGATTIAQDKQSSVIWGMPGAAVEEGGVDSILPLLNIANRVTSLSKAKQV